MNLWEYAEELRKDFIDYATTVCNLTVPTEPKVSYSRLGPQVITCESLIVAGVSADGVPANEGQVCTFYQIGTFVITLTRDCAVEFNDDGTDDPKAVADVSDRLSKDSGCLWAWCEQMGYWITKDFNIAFEITGGIAITSLSLTIGVP